MTDIITTPDKLEPYRNAAATLTDFVQDSGLSLNDAADELAQLRATFNERYAPEKLAALDDEHLLSAIFYTTGDNTNALCCWLEMNKECRQYYGSISGGSAFKFGLFQNKDTGTWISGSPRKQQELTEEEALVLGRQIRDALVTGAEIIANSTLDSLQDYEELDQALTDAMGQQICEWGWVHKYFSIAFSDKLSSFHATFWQLHVLRALRIEPSEHYYARSGQIAMVQNLAGWNYCQFIEAFIARFREPIQFIRLGTSDGNQNYAAEWADQGIIGIGWNRVGDLTGYVTKDGIDTTAIQESLEKEYYTDDKRTASRKAGEMARFFRLDNSSVVVIMEGQKLIALADHIGDYGFEQDSQMAHQRSADWKFVFDEGETLPGKAEGKLTSCYQIKDAQNLEYLYDRYYYGEDKGNHLEMEDAPAQPAVDPIRPISAPDAADDANDGVDEKEPFDVTKLHSNNRMRVWMNPVVLAIREFGGSASRPEVHARIMEEYVLTDDSKALDDAAEKKLKNDIDWARNYLNYEGILDSTSPNGIWALSALGDRMIISDRLSEMIVAKWVRIKAAEREGKPYPQMDLTPYYEFLNEDGEYHDKYTDADFLKDVFMTDDSFKSLKSLLLHKKNVILQGAPGVGKTFTAKRLAYSIMGEKDESRVEFVQFHQNYSYEDFVMGYKPSTDGFALKEGVFYRFCKKAQNQPQKKFFFIIDEINRGNLSKIFGELLMLVEADYRNQAATLAYGGELTVPENLYIIGMMNTADRSLALIDYALRRRFSFFEMNPGFDSDGFKALQKQFQNTTFDRLVSKVKDLNKVIREDDSLGSGFQIGHSYFCGKECTEDWMQEIVNYDLIPTLQEYWFDDKKTLDRWKSELTGVFDDK